MKFFIFLFLSLRLFANTLVTENDPATLVENLVSVITGDLYLAEAAGTPEERHTRHVYTGKGLLAQKIKPDGTSIEHTYDAFDRCIETHSSDGTIHYTYCYNKIGQLIASRDELTGATTQKEWSINAELLKEQLGNGLCVTSTYDPQGRRQTLTLPDNSQIIYSYDPLHLS